MGFMGVLERLGLTKKLAGPHLVIACRHGECSDCGTSLTHIGVLQVERLANAIDEKVHGRGKIFASSAGCAKNTANAIKRKLGNKRCPYDISVVESSDWLTGKEESETLLRETPPGCDFIVLVAHYWISGFVDATQRSDGHRESIGFIEVPPGGALALHRESGKVSILP